MPASASKNIKKICDKSRNHNTDLAGGHMNWSVWVLVVTVGLLNIAFNVRARAAAAVAESWISGIFTTQFLLLFVIGCSSLLALYTLYFQGVVLSRAILLMGSVSILGGTAVGLYMGQKLEGAEWLMLATLTALFVYRLGLKAG